MTSPTFDYHQQSLITLHQGKHSVSAPPGAGKTALLTARVHTALMHYSDADIACLTFTVRAAVEMQQRCLPILGDRQPFIGNFHAFCMHILRQSQHVDYRRYRYAQLLPEEYCRELVSIARDNREATSFDPTVVDKLTSLVDTAQLTVAQTQVYQPSWFKIINNVYCGIVLLQQSGEARYSTAQHAALKNTAEQLLHDAIHRAVADIMRIESLHHPEHALQLLSCVLSGYQQQKHIANALDFDDLLCVGYCLLLQEPRRFGFIQIDEVQDLNPLQWAIVRAISNSDSHLFAVGDEAQSIYGFLGADLALLANQTSNFEAHTLLNNYRCDPAIIDLLNGYREAHWAMPAITPCKPATSPDKTMLMSFATMDDECMMAARGVAQILTDQDRNIGLLLPTNKLCETYCNTMLQAGIPFFRVNESDLLQNVIVQDAKAYLRIVSGMGNRVDWWSLVYRLTRTGSGNKYKRKDVINMVNQLSRLRVNLGEVLAASEHYLDYPLRRFSQALTDEQDGVVIFDTETTGLDFCRDKIIQIAAVKVVAGDVVEEFDQYVFVDLDGDPYLSSAYEQSVSIHNIGEDKIRSAAPWSDVLRRFMAFVGECPLVAHNLRFDTEMLDANALDLDFAPDLQAQYCQFRQRLKFDTLSLSRQLIPGLPKYKLEYLLDELGLDGVNSHNALDDVKATASLLQHLSTLLPAHCEQIDAMLEDFEGLAAPFATQWWRVTQQASAELLRHMRISLVDGFEMWLNVAKHTPSWYNADALHNVVEELPLKLYPWLDKHGFIGTLSQQLDVRYYQQSSQQSPQQSHANERHRIQLIEQYNTLKEPDLIDPSSDRLIISTVHRAKGLEFDTVYLPVCTDSNYPRWLPDSMSPAQRDKETQEACRLLYVALSRPKHKLIVSYHRQVGNYSRTLSRFLQPVLSRFQYRR